MLPRRFAACALERYASPINSRCRGTLGRWSSPCRSPSPHHTPARRGHGCPVEDWVHLSDCRDADTYPKLLTRDEARTVLATGAVRPCPYCRPETSLGLID
ncbi:DUF6233 domain-containing protein [Streptomyces sp. NPDC014724]|uniref:DUF6233 domain-containing protein n=1 Tax=unclassified Streptomyces TaxID=2593676 RepID=UPI0036F4D935